MSVNSRHNNCYDVFLTNVELSTDAGHFCEKCDYQVKHFATDIKNYKKYHKHALDV